ncbi:MAG: hypothetical protein Kilf2KO_35600 [Rhodospirillales bacterium]
MIVMGILLVLGFVFIIVVIIQRLSGEKAPPLRGDVTLPLAEDCRLADAWSAGGLLYLRIGGAAGCDAVLLFDPDSQNQVGRIDLGKADPADQ